ncbi:chemotaxis protein [Magnetospirillum aberrantis]|uniref:Chemotaxis protein n=1 Tax=Magnetospirillum aberrantis SpK TaxID=908842 RepID=A0A7C9QV01_9PROT|nr:chemotaxis protein [Magnetospirillum aberrantis]NFV80799.1 chemotaxis protein [Magnetospirillum aberrantis SpK]
MTETVQATRTTGATLRTERIESRASALLSDCRRAFHAFGELDELAENLRILSLNAELAAGRAGDKGRAVRALTQYTRELVNRLAQIRGEMNQQRGRTDTLSTQIEDDLKRLRSIEEQSGSDSPAFAECMKALVDKLDTLSTNVEDLSRRAHGVEEVVSQSDSIATNIAIEAAAAGVHEKEFRTVSDTMRRYVDDLRKMIDEASDSVRRALEKTEALRRLGVENLNDLRR